MTIGTKTFNFTATNVLLSIIAFCIGIIMWFFYGVVNKVDEIADAVGKYQAENAKMFERIDNSVLYTNELSKKVNENNERSIDNASRMDVLEFKNAIGH